MNCNPLWHNEENVDNKYCYILNMTTVMTNRTITLCRAITVSTTQSFWFWTTKYRLVTKRNKQQATTVPARMARKLWSKRRDFFPAYGASQVVVTQLDLWANPPDKLLERANCSNGLACEQLPHHGSAANTNISRSPGIRGSRWHENSFHWSVCSYASNLSFESLSLKPQ